MAANLKIGYARVSTTEQNLNRQVEALEKYGCDRIFTDKASGRDLNREGYRTALNVMRAGDILVIESLDRLSRRNKDIKQEMLRLREMGVELVILDFPNIMTDNPIINDMLKSVLIELMGYIAEKELITTKERQRQGIEAAKERGVHIGRPKIKFNEKQLELIKDWHNGKITATQCHKALSISRSTLYRFFDTPEKLSIRQSSTE